MDVILVVFFLFCKSYYFTLAVVVVVVAAVVEGSASLHHGKYVSQRRPHGKGGLAHVLPRRSGLANLQPHRVIALPLQTQVKSCSIFIPCVGGGPLLVAVRKTAQYI